MKASRTLFAALLVVSWHLHGARFVAPDMPAATYADTETVTNFSFSAKCDNARILTFALEIDATPSNNVDVAFGRDADVGDRENHYDDPVSHGANPGLKWIAASGADTLLGYAYKAPLDAKGGIDIVADWCRLRSGIGDTDAWMKANGNIHGRNACSIRVLSNGRIQYRYFKKGNRSWNLRTKYTEITEEIEL